MNFLESIIILILEFFNRFTDSYGYSIILLSAFLSIVLMPLYHLTGILEEKERNAKEKLDVYITKINTIKDKIIRHKQLKELYLSFSYYPFYSLRSLSSLFIQIPVLVVAYRALDNYAPIKSANFWKMNLGSSDILFLGLNLLPVIMTILNISSVYLSSDANSKERKQGIFIAMIFFVLLYNSSAAILLYWTFNQLFNFIRYAIAFYKEKRNLDLNFKLTFKQPPKTKFNIALSLCAMAFPALLYFKNNTVYFIGNEALVYFSVLFGIAILLPLLFSHIITLAVILAFMFFPIINEATNYAGNAILMRILVFGVFLYFCAFFKKQKSLLCIFFTCASAYVLFGIYQNRGVDISDVKTQIPKELLELPLKDSSSIYIFMQDGFPHEDYASYLQLPHYNELMNFFRENDFKIYNVYSMADYTHATMASVFDINADILPKSKNGISTTIDFTETITQELKYQDMHRQFTSGNNKSNLLLQAKGYKTGLAGQNFRYMFNENNFYDFGISQENSKPKNKLLKALLVGSLNSLYFENIQERMNFNAKTGDNAALDFTNFIANHPLKDNLFAWCISGPGHSSTMGAFGGTEGEIAYYTARYQKAVYEMQIEIATAVKSNPNAIVIFMSDHGGFLIDGGYRFPPNYDLSKMDYMKFRDIFGAFMAIRFPDRERAAKYDNDFNVVQDLFPIVFAYLFDSEIPLKYKIQDTEVQVGPHKFDKGIFYPHFYSEDSK